MDAWCYFQVQAAIISYIMIDAISEGNGRRAGGAFWDFLYIIGVPHGPGHSHTRFQYLFQRIFL